MGGMYAGVYVIGRNLKSARGSSYYNAQTAWRRALRWGLEPNVTHPIVTFGQNAAACRRVLSYIAGYDSARIHGAIASRRTLTRFGSCMMTLIAAARAQSRMW